MAGPLIHAAATLPIAVYSWRFHKPITFFSKNTLILFSVIFCGFLMDFADHLTLQRAGKILSGDIENMALAEYRMHTPYALGAVVVTSLILKNPLPLLSYATHIIIDSGRKTQVGESLPAFLNQFWPEKLKYRAPPLEFLRWPKRIRNKLFKEGGKSG
ncbi:MAG: hypothetical protein HY764_02775 [Candidatus Portnoybacteria bacterium]|nr:hypothetical protein [Candidatus Portnoybacteria bacterium]